MKKPGLSAVCVIFVLSMVWTGSFAMAGAADYGISAGYGKSCDNIDIYRLGVQKKFSAQWFETGAGHLSGYFELSGNMWEKSGEKTTGAALSPVFVYYFNTGFGKKVIPYVEGGIGAAYIDDYRIAGRNLATNFQFEDRISFGVIMDHIDIKVGYMHYSNASLKSPNDGIDIWLGTITWQF